MKTTAIFIAISALAANGNVTVSTVMQGTDQNHNGKLSLAEYLPLNGQEPHHGKEPFATDIPSRPSQCHQLQVQRKT